MTFFTDLEEEILKYMEGNMEIGFPVPTLTHTIGP